MAHTGVVVPRGAFIDDYACSPQRISRRTGLHPEASHAAAVRLQVTLRHTLASRHGTNVVTRTWSTGQLARAAGITARTLRHYEQIGLLVPTRTAAGRRAYSAQDVTRLYRILGLRKLGLSLDEVAATLDSTAGDLASVVRRHIEEVDIAIAARQALRVRLRRILAALQTADRSVPIEHVIDALEGMRMMERYLTPEQLAHLRARRTELGEEPDRLRASLVAQIEEARLSGVDAHSDAVRVAARRLRDVFAEFVNDRETAVALVRMVEAEGPEAATHGMVNAEFGAYLASALEGEEWPSR